ncbi:hypothetical protein RI129_012125 [Pyrocoelia pectoralis]|uniref:Uncharacterized protein n=1 Tax=Pyrocoelia pectoralis TaxID=417401 RepID=A0AAN7V5V5_9COLE
MTYGAETRAETSRTKQLFSTVEMYTLRVIVGKTKVDRVRNSDIPPRVTLFFSTLSTTCPIE